MARLVSFQRSNGNLIYVNPDLVRAVTQDGRDVVLHFDDEHTALVTGDLTEVANTLKNGMSG